MDTVPTVAHGLTRIATHVDMSTRVYVMDPERSRRVRMRDPGSTGVALGACGIKKRQDSHESPIRFFPTYHS